MLLVVVLGVVVLVHYVCLTWSVFLIDSNGYSFMSVIIVCFSITVGNNRMVQTILPKVQAVMHEELV